MKKIASISSVVMSTLILLVFTVMPHHHHEDMTCITMELCDNEDAVNYEHTNRNDAPNSGHDQFCIAEAEYTASSATHELKYKVSTDDNNSNNHPHLFFISLYFLVPDFISDNSGLLSSASGYGEYIFVCKSAETSRLNGLRAPPRMIS